MGYGAGTSVYAKRDRERWLSELPEATRPLAELLYEEHDGLAALKAKAEKALLAEARMHREWRLLKTCPGMGPIRTAEFLPVVVTPYRFQSTRWALLKNPENLRASEKAKLELVRKTNKALYRAYLLKETFLDVFTYRRRYYARRALDAWLAWAQRSRLPPFVRLARTVRRHLDGILAFIESRLTNARLEGMNNKVRLISHRAFGFHSAQSLIAMIYRFFRGICG